MRKDLIDDKFGRFREIPLALSQRGHQINGICLSYAPKREGYFKDETVRWNSINATGMKLPGLIRFVHEASKAAKASDLIWACSDSIYGIMGYLLSKKIQYASRFRLI